MDNQIKLHDSELLQVDIEAGTLLIDAYVHRSGPDIKRQGGYQQTLFRFENIQTERANAGLSGDIWNGILETTDLNPKDLIPLPVKIATSVKMTITLRQDGREAAFRGDGLTIEEAGPYQFVEFWRD